MVSKRKKRTRPIVIPDVDGQDIISDIDVETAIENLPADVLQPLIDTTAAAVKEITRTLVPVIQQVAEAFQQMIVQSFT